MSIAIQCEHCNKKYNAPDSMAGKRIKCRHCGKIVLIPGADDGPDMSALESLEGSAIGMESAQESRAGSRHGTGGAAGASRPGTGTGKGIAHTLSRTGDAAELGMADEGDSLIPRRPSVAFDFPGAAVIDNIAPVLLLLLGLGWLAVMAVFSTQPGDPGWVGVLRLGLYLLLYVAVAYPLCFAAVKWASRQHRFMLPPGARLRAFGAFAVPFAMSFAFFLSGQTLVMLIVGTILGAIIAGAAVWFLFRVQPLEMGNTLGGATGAYAGSVLASYLILLGVNMGFAAIMRGAETNDLARSPVAPGLAWDVPVKTADDGKPKRLVKTTDKIVISSTGPTTNESVTSTRPSVENPAANRVGTESVGATGTNTNAGNTGGNAVAMLPTDVRPGGTDAATATPTTKQSDPTTRRVTPTPEPVAPTSVFIAEATPGKLGQFSEILYPVMPSNFMAVIRSRPDGAEDMIEVWSINPLEKKNEKQFRRDKEAFAGYALSASGDLVARMSTWPKLMIEVWSFKEQKVVREFPADAPVRVGAGAGAGAGAGTGAGPAAAAAAPAAIMGPNMNVRILGFAANDNLVVSSISPGALQGGVDVLRTKPGTPRVGSFVVDRWEEGSGNPSIDPTGTKLAVATNVQGQGGIDVYNLVAPQPKPMKTFYIDIQPWSKPTGLAWSRNGQNQNIAAFWDDGQGRGLLLDFKFMGDPKRPAHEYRYDIVPYPKETAAAYGKGRTFDWLGDHATCLLFGRYLIDMESGKLLGELGVAGAKSQQVLEKDQLIVQQTAGAEGGADGVFVVKLKSEAIATKRSDLKKGSGAAASVR